MTINNQNLCTSCFNALGIGQTVCSLCGYNEAYKGVSTYPGALSVGTIFHGRYVIGKVLGKGGFGITYLAYDCAETKKVAIKEYFPDTLCHRNPGELIVAAYQGKEGEHFKKGAEKFYNEAKLISGFKGYPGLVSVYKYYNENGTSYYVMEYLEGRDLKAYMTENGGVLTERQILDVIAPLLDALIAIHHNGVLHRDISPDNIYVNYDGTVTLLDFGAARQVIGEATRSLSVILKQGFAPLEQYQKRGKQGPWTDIYALGATIYYCLTGLVLQTPMDRLEREKLSMTVKVSTALQAVMNKMLAVRISGRYQSVSALKQDLISRGLIYGTLVSAMPPPNPVYNPVTPARQEAPQYYQNNTPYDATPPVYQNYPQYPAYPYNRNKPNRSIVPVLIGVIAILTATVIIAVLVYFM